MNVKILKDEEVGIPFPKLMIQNLFSPESGNTCNSRIIALCTSNYEGIVLSSNNKTIQLGFKLSKDDIDSFKDFHGKLELSNH